MVFFDQDTVVCGEVKLRPYSTSSFSHLRIILCDLSNLGLQRKLCRLYNWYKCGQTKYYAGAIADRL